MNFEGLQEPRRTPEMLCERATGKLSAWVQDSVNNTDCAAGLSEMVREDLKAAKLDELVKKHGYAVLNCHE